ncbi:hypothetical protein EJ06DRAFT_585235 [Trichodelitschia bisporula]|uniref:Uncharacterized protein n=1 Tax=Trichodelitschia bisporula TaxID=703511 RepID=A0A6G1HJW5_9PEZI|nr:hypothetical protein EJ06DRAFT_585235 [Trichodelitschia bisporula]
MERAPNFPPARASIAEPAGPPPTTANILSPNHLRATAAWIRDDLDPLVAREGPNALHPDDVITLHSLLVALQRPGVLGQAWEQALIEAQNARRGGPAAKVRVSGASGSRSPPGTPRRRMKSGRAGGRARGHVAAEWSQSGYMSPESARIRNGARSPVPGGDVSSAGTGSGASGRLLGVGSALQAQFDRAVRDNRDNRIARSERMLRYMDLEDQEVARLDGEQVIPPILNRDILRFSRIHLAVSEMCGKATRWPACLADEAERVVKAIEEVFGKISSIGVCLFEPGGRLWGVIAPGDGTKEEMIRMFERENPRLVDSTRAYEHGSLGFHVGQWWVHPALAFRAGIIDERTLDGGICYDTSGVYAIVLTGNAEANAATPDEFTYRCTSGGRGISRLTAADWRSRCEVRVLRSQSLGSLWAPRAGVRYDGVHRVTGWTFHPLRPGEPLHIDVHMRRDDSIPSSVFQAHPTADELDDYKEFKLRHRMRQADEVRAEEVAQIVELTRRAKARGLAPPVQEAGETKAKALKSAMKAHELTGVQEVEEEDIFEEAVALEDMELESTYEGESRSPSLRMPLGSPMDLTQMLAMGPESPLLQTPLSSPVDLAQMLAMGPESPREMESPPGREIPLHGVGHANLDLGGGEEQGQRLRVSFEIRGARVLTGRGEEQREHHEREPRGRRRVRREGTGADGSYEERDGVLIRKEDVPVRKSLGDIGDIGDDTTVLGGHDPEDVEKIMSANTSPGPRHTGWVPVLGRWVRHRVGNASRRRHGK